MNLPMFRPDHIGTYSPAVSLTNEELAKKFNFSDDFLREKLGFAGCRHEKHKAPVTYMARKAVESLREKDSQFDPSKIECLVVVTQNPDTKLPATSNILQNDIGIPKTALCFDINQGCSGFVIGFNVIQSIMTINGLERGLLITADAYSKILNKDDRSAVPLFSDGAAAIGFSTKNPGSVLSWDWGSDGAGASYLETRSTRGEALDFTGEILSINGREVFNFAVENAPKSIEKCVWRANLTRESLDYVALHQANNFIVSAIRRKLGMSDEQCPFLLNDAGNTIASTIPMLLTEMNKTVDFSNKKVALSGFGVGLSWASVLMQF